MPLENVRVAIIVDHLDPTMRRRCFWEDCLRGLACQFELVSLIQQMAERRFFDVYSYDVVIFNWCVLDGAVMYNSDRLQAIVAFYDYHFKAFVREGGIVILEDQPRRWQPNQEAYDSLLPGEVHVQRLREPLYYAPYSETAYISMTHRTHPLVRNLPLQLRSSYSHLNVDWFPEGSTSKRSLQELHPTKIYSGVFTSWRPAWIPLIYADDREHPVMLVKADGDGVWVFTTMFIASSNVRALVENLVVGARRNRDMIRKYHERERTRRRGRSVIALGACAMLGALLYLLLRLNVIALAFIPMEFTSTIAGNVVTSVVLSLGVWALGRAIRWLGVWARWILGK